jgi:predicted PurR-regulated permease PerM
MERKHLTIDISSRTIFLVAISIGAVVLFWQIRQTLLLILTAVVLAALIDSVASAFQKLRMSRVLALVVTYVLFVGVFVSVLSLAIPVFVRELAEFVSMFPSRSQIGTVLAPVKQFLVSAESLRTIGTASDPTRVLANLYTQFSASGVTQYAGQVVSTIANTLLVIIISFYLAVSDRGVDAFLRAVTPIEYEGRVLRLWHRTEAKIGAWFRGQVLQAFILAAVTYVGLLLLGIPYAFMLGLLAMVLGLIPFGIILATIPAVMLAYLGGGVGLAMIVAGFYIVVQQLENYVLAPYIVRRSTGVPSLVVLLALLLGAQIAGVVGLVLAIPLSVFLMELIKDREEAKARHLKSDHE